MDEKSVRSLYEQEINKLVESLLPYGAGNITDRRLKLALDQVAQTAFLAGQSYALTSLMDVDQALDEINRRISPRKISKRRLQAIARERHDRWGTGAIMGGVWLFRPCEIDGLIPGDVGHPKSRLD